MDPREVDRVVRFCREVDLLVTEGPGTSNVEVLERARARLAELIWKQQWADAEELAYAILLCHAGCCSDGYLDDLGLR